MVTLSAGFVVIAFAVLAHYLGVVSRSREAIRVARLANAILHDKQMGDSDKEKILQRYSLQLFGLFGMLVVGSAIALLVPFGLLWMVEIAGYPIINKTLEMLQRWEFIVGTVVVCFIIFYSKRRWFS